MTSPEKTRSEPLSLRAAFETEYARREMERRAQEEARRKRLEADLAGAGQLLAALTADPEFLQSRGLTADQRRYMVNLDHERFRITAYFDNGAIAVTLADKRAAPAGATAPKRQENVETLADALRVIAQFLVEEIR